VAIGLSITQVEVVFSPEVRSLTLMPLVMAWVPFGTLTVMS
jgi:hypothetical protein